VKDAPSGPGPIVVEFPTELYGLEAIKRAAYRLSDRLLVDITPGERTIVCSLVVRTPTESSRDNEPIEAFKLEVLDQDLRSSIAAETEAVRNLILAYAFSKTGLQGE
jgi:His-Xaa-Ser system protein HxsD